jgi:hypothetical protein
VVCLWQRIREVVPHGFQDRATGLVLAFLVADAAAEQARLRQAGPTFRAATLVRAWRID